MSKKIDFSLILACYNEGRTLTNSLKEIKETLDDLSISWEVICIDDASLDLTPKTLSNFCKSDKRFKLLVHSINVGRGGTVKEGMLYAKGSIVGYIDVDLEVSADYIPRFIREIKKGNDLVLAVRIYKEELTTVARWISSKIYSFMVTYLLDISVSDTEAGYKFFKRDKILKILEKTKDNKWFFDTEIIARSLRARLKIKEIPVLFIRRKEKKSTVRLIPDSINYLRAIWRFKLNR